MKVPEIPFNEFLGIKQAPGESGTLLELDESSSFLNHIGTVHACVQLSLAEASSGEFLMRALPEYESRAVAVLRRVEAKFRNPIRGKIFSRAVTTESEVRQAAQSLASKGRAMVAVTIEIVDNSGVVGMAATFEWFARMLPVS